MGAYVVMLSLGKKINLLRKRAGLSQEGLAAALDVSQNLVSAWERDANLPRLPQLVKLGGLLRAPIDYLVDEHDDRNADELADELAVRQAAGQLGWGVVYARVLANAPAPIGHVKTGVVPTIQAPAEARKKA